MWRVANDIVDMRRQQTRRNVTDRVTELMITRQVSTRPVLCGAPMMMMMHDGGEQETRYHDYTLSCTYRACTPVARLCSEAGCRRCGTYCTCEWVGARVGHMRK